MNKNDIYLKGRFLGQYTARKDAMASSLSERYYDIQVDAGSVFDFEVVTKKKWDAIEDGGLSYQKYFQSVKCLPAQKHDAFTGYTIRFTKVKVENIDLQNITVTSNGDTVGDIACDFYGFMKGERVKPPKKKVLKSRGYSKTSVRHTHSREVNWFRWSGFFDGVGSGLADAIALVVGGAFSIVSLLMVLLTLLQTDVKVLLVFLLLGGIGYLLLQAEEKAVAVVDKGFGCLAQLFSFFGLGLVLIAVFSVLLKQCDAEHVSQTEPPSYQEDDETTVKRTVVKYNDTIKFVANDTLKRLSELDTLITHKRVWYDFNREQHHIDLSVKQSDVAKAYKLREQYRLSSSNLGDVYRDMAKYNDSMLTFVYAALDDLRFQKSFDEKKFLEVIVTLVQDIPYRLVLSDSCTKAGVYPPGVNAFLAKCQSKCCIGGIRFGFQAPVEFIGNLYGDCDTRTVLLYTILKHYEYDVVIMNSKQYAHSILGVNTSYYSGIYKEKDLKKYYFIETTNIGFFPGSISRDLRNIKFWEIVTH